jgi:hypothetical protein
MATRKPVSASKAAPRSNKVKPAAKSSRPASKKTAVKAVPAKKVVPAVPKTIALKKPAEKITAAPKAPKLKLVRDSFTMPKVEYTAIDVLKQRAAKLARPVKKSELLRAGIKILSALDDKALLVALNNVPTIKTGRPGKG